MKAREATRREATYAVRHWHYSHKAPSNSFGYSYFSEGGVFLGVVLFGNGGNYHIGNPYGLFMGEVVELVRVALNGGQGHGHTSEIVADALRRLHRDRPMVRLVVSYADADQGHIGTIYQATNWLYMGKVKAGENLNIYVDGEKVHHRTFTKDLPPSEAVDDLRRRGHTVEVSETKGKQKYLFPFDRKLRKRLLMSAMPYPKAQDTPENQ